MLRQFASSGRLLLIGVYLRKLVVSGDFTRVFCLLSTTDCVVLRKYNISSNMIVLKLYFI